MSFYWVDGIVYMDVVMLSLLPNVQQRIQDLSKECNPFVVFTQDGLIALYILGTYENLDAQQLNDRYSKNIIGVLITDVYPHHVEIGSVCLGKFNTIRSAEKMIRGILTAINSDKICARIPLNAYNFDTLVQAYAHVGFKNPIISISNKTCSDQALGQAHLFFIYNKSNGLMTDEKDITNLINHIYETIRQYDLMKSKIALGLSNLDIGNVNYISSPQTKVVNSQKAFSKVISPPTSEGLMEIEYRNPPSSQELKLYRNLFASERRNTEKQKILSPISVSNISSKEKISIPTTIKSESNQIINELEEWSKRLEKTARENKQKRKLSESKDYLDEFLEQKRKKELILR